MDILSQLFKKEEIDEILEMNPNIQYQKKEDLRKIIKLLADQKCSNRILRNILQTNPMVLTRSPEDVEELIIKLKEYNILHLDKLFDEYPFILIKDAYEIDGYFINKRSENISLEEARELLEKEPFQIDV